MRFGPTANVLAFARLQPGGIIRWHEARKCYLAFSPSAQGDVRRGGPFHFHMTLGKVLQRHFTRVEGVDGHYVLNEMMTGED